MIIKDKLESINKIKSLGLNQFPEQLFMENKGKIQEFLGSYPVIYYAIRDKSKPSGIFK